MYIYLFATGAELEASMRNREVTATVGYQLELPNANVTFRGWFCFVFLPLANEVCGKVVSLLPRPMWIEWHTGLFIMSLPVWLSGTRFLPGGLCLWSHVPCSFQGGSPSCMKNRRYASYWNAFLFLFCFLFSLALCSTRYKSLIVRVFKKQTMLWRLLLRNFHTIDLFGLNFLLSFSLSCTKLYLLIKMLPVFLFCVLYRAAR